MTKKKSTEFSSKAKRSKQLDGAVETAEAAEAAEAAEELSDDDEFESSDVFFYDLNDANEEDMRRNEAKHKEKNTTSTNTDTLAVNSSSTQHDVNGENVKNNEMSCFWSDLHLSRPLLKVFPELSFISPTPIQKETIPLALQGNDILGTAETGSGKTAAFLLPIIERLLQSPSLRMRSKAVSKNSYLHSGVASKALILLPTRELALQCFNCLESLAKYTLVTRVMVAGGMDIKLQEASLRLQPDVIVGTPGRILDLLLNSQSVHIESLEILVLDEADRLLEFGFQEDCNQIIRHCDRGRQTMLFSATLSDDVEKLAQIALNKPIRVSVNKSHKVTNTLQQQFVYIQEEAQREAAVFQLCSKLHKKSVILFFQTKKQAHRVAILFRLMNWKCVELHGNLSQTVRLESLNRFRKGEIDFLLATELASRGLDIPEVEVVINYEVPLDAARYVHRVGRTARIGRCGNGITIFSDDEKLRLKRIIRQVSTKDEEEKSTFSKKKISKQVLDKWMKEIKGFEGDVAEYIRGEQIEREMRLADMRLQKVENMQTYADEIRARPPKKWHLSKTEKQTVKEASYSKAFESISSTNRRKSGDSDDSTNLKKKKKKDGGVEDSKKEMSNDRMREEMIQRATKSRRRGVEKKGMKVAKNFKAKPRRNERSSGLKSTNSTPTEKKQRKRVVKSSAFKSKKRYKRR